MMEYIAHRINTIEELKKTPKEYGVEVDLRDYGDKLILQHDPYLNGIEFEEYLRYYEHGTIILNIKSEGIENKVLELIKKYSVKKYFFLDSTFPMIVNLISSGENNVAIRYSEFESSKTIFSLNKQLLWVWIDCFNKMPLDKKTYNNFKEIDTKLCLVSPELQGHDLNYIEIFKKIINSNDFKIDAICTKNPKMWIM